MPALVFDCDGVLADTERTGHLPAFNETFAEFGLPVRWTEDDYRDKLRIGGGKERLASLLTPQFVTDAGLPAEPAGQAALVAQWHRRKSEIYRGMVGEGRLPGRPGIARIIEEAFGAGWALAVASTSAEASVRAVLEHIVGAYRAGDFTILAGDIVPHKKPAPDIYLLAVDRLGVDVAETVVIEDSQLGLTAAHRAGLACVVTVNGYTADEDFTDAALVVDSLGEPGGPPARVLANRGQARPGDWLTLADLAAVLPGRQTP